MTAKVILITGTSSGLGAALAINAAKQGHKVYATMRNTAKADGLKTAATDAGAEITILALDVQDSATIDKCVKTIIETEGRIDVLINNAGAGFVRTTEQATEEDVQWIMDVNFMGVMRCTKAVLPHMRQARAGHIINITSVGGLVGQPFNEIYCAAKFAVEGYTEAMASYIQPNFGVNFTAVEPGGIASEFATSALSHFMESGGMLEDEYKPILEKYIGGAQARANTPEGKAVFQTSEEVAQVVLDIMADKKPPIRTRTSDWAEGLCDLKTSNDPDGRKMQEKVIGMFLS